MVSQGVGGHEGYSGTPLWKIQQQNAAHREAALQESLAYAAARTKPIVPPNILAEASSLGGVAGRPFARHVLIKCVRKVAQNLRVDLPSSGLFADQAPIGLYCLFDGQSGAGQPGPAAAEYCARNFYKKILENLSSLPSGCTSDTFVKATLVKSFEDLDREMRQTQPDIQDGCGASVALVIGDYLFTAVLGLCEGVLCEVVGNDRSGASLGRNQGRCHATEERARLERAGGTVVGEGPTARVVCAAGTSGVSRSLGDPEWKKSARLRIGDDEERGVLSCIPEVQSFKLSWADKHLFVILASKPLADQLQPEDMIKHSFAYSAQPRAACGELVHQATGGAVASPSVQYTAVQVWFLQGGTGGAAQRAAEEASAATGEAPFKRARSIVVASGPGGETQAARLRHILVKVAQDGARQLPSQAGSGVKTRLEAEILLRGLLGEFRVEYETLRKQHGKFKKPEDLALKSERFLKLCKQHSACPTAQKGGGMCGDLGWVSRDAQKKLGREFQEAMSVLRPGDWSDIVPSSDGLHIVQRIA